MKKISLCISFVFSVTNMFIYSADQTWIGPDGGTFDIDANWNPGPFPNSSSDNAFFDLSAVGGTVNLGTSISLNNINFVSSGTLNPYTLDVSGGFLDFFGTVSNTSGVTQFIIVENLGFIQYEANSVASSGNPIQYTLQNSGSMLFLNADAGNATYNLLSGLVQFNNSIGDQSTFILTNGNLISTGNSSIGSLSGAGLISINGNLSVGNLGINETFSGNINDFTNTGSLTKVGSGTWTLLGNNNYTSGTTVSAGTLSGTTNSLKNNILNNANLIFDQGFAGTFSGAISGSGGVDFIGGGPISLIGINSYTGGTNVTATTLIGNTSTLVGTINLFNASSLQFNQVTYGVFNGEIIGDNTNSLVTTGAGTVVMNTNSAAFLGDTTVLDGMLNLNATLGGNVFVPSGTLNGTGTIANNLSVSGTGTIEPGTMIGTLNVLGNFSQTDGTFEVHINGAGQSSLLNVGGTANIGSNASLFVTSDDGVYSPFVDYLFLSAPGGIVGNFTNISSANPEFVPIVSFNDAMTQAFLSFFFEFLVFGETQNERQVARQLDSITDPTPAQVAFLTALMALPPADIVNALNQMTGQQYANLLGRAELANRQFIRQLYNPVRERLTYDPCCQCCCDYTPFLEIWTTGSVGRGLFDGSFEADSVRMTEYEATLGMQTNVNDLFLVGAALTYLRDNVFYTVGGIGQNNTVLGGLYGLYRPYGYYVLADFIIGHSNDFVKREINIGALNYTPSTNVGMFQTAGYAEFGIDHRLTCFLVQPFLGLEIDYDFQDRLTERSDTPLNMTFESRSYTSAFGRFGAHLTPLKPFWGLYVTMDAAFDWRFSSTRNRIHGFFNDFGTDFPIIGTDFDRYGIDGSIFISKIVRPGIEIFVEGSGFIGDRTSAYEGTLGLMFIW